MKRLLLICWLSNAILCQGQDGTIFLEETSRKLAQNSLSERWFWNIVWKESLTKPDSVRTAEQLQYQGSVFAATNQLNRAVEYYEKAAQRSPRAHGMIGYIYLRDMHDYPRALQHFNAYDALTVNFDDIEGNNPVSYYRGVIFLKTGEYAQAIEQLNRAIGDIEGKHGAEWVNYRYYITRARGLLATNQPEKALADLDKAIKNYNKSALAYYQRGRALQQLGRLAEAKTAFIDAQFFFRANRAEVLRVNQPFLPEDQFFPLYEAEIDETLAKLNP